MNNSYDNSLNPKVSKIFTVSEINRLVKNVLNDNFTTLWIKGEVSNFTEASSGHWYFSLKDNQAQVRCTMFRGQNFNLGWLPKDGDLVEAQCQIGLYEAQGQYQLNIQMIQRAGLGALFEKFNQLKIKLESEGLFDEDQKKPLPAYPLTIGVITSPDAAALRDVLTTLNRRANKTNVVIYPTLVQGELAANQIIEAIKIANERLEVDVLLLCRGGGSIEDLWPFNEEKLAYEISNSKLPIISAVGHETDFTIADFVADLRAATPTAGAEIISENLYNLNQNLDYYAEHLLKMIQTKIEQQMMRCDYLEKRLLSPKQIIKVQEEKIKGYETRIKNLLDNKFSHYNNRVILFKSALTISRYKQMLENIKSSLMNLEKRLLLNCKNKIKMTMDKIENYDYRLTLLNPELILERGYSIIYDDDKKIVKDVSGFKVDDRIHLKLYRGNAEAKITKKS